MPAEDSSHSERLRVWLEKGESGYWLRDAATGEALQDEGFAPGKRLALVPEPDHEHDPNAVGVWDAERRVQAGYLPAGIAPKAKPDDQAVSLWEFLDEGGRRVGLRVLLAPADAWIQEPRS